MKTALKKPRSRHTKTVAAFKIELPPAITSHTGWEGVIRSKARRLRGLMKNFGPTIAVFDVVETAIACCVFVVEKHPARTDALDEWEYDYIYESKYKNGRLNSLEERFETLAARRGVSGAVLLSSTLDGFLDYAEVNRCQSTFLVCETRDLINRDDPCPRMLKLEVLLPEYVVRWINELVAPTESTQDFIRDAATAKALHDRGLPSIAA